MASENSALEEAVAELLGRSKHHGSHAIRSELDVLNHDFADVFPQWFVDCLSSFPIADLHLGWQAFPTEDDLDGMTWLVMSNPAMLRELLESYPAKYLYDRGYFPIANDDTGAGNVFLMATSSDGDSPVYELWHDISHDPQVLVTAIENGESGAREVTPSFIDFVRTCPVKGPWDT